jgi:glycosyltransferase involved in cell wall biosynthesis
MMIGSNMNVASLTVIHVIGQLRFGAGRYVVDTAIEQALGLNYRVELCVSSDADEYWRTDPNLVSELAENGIAVHTIGDFFHRRTELLFESANRLYDLRRKCEGKVIIHAHTAMAAAIGHWAKPDGLVITCHGWGAGRPAEIDLQDALAWQLGDAAVTYSQNWADRLKHEMAVDSPLVIPMGLNLNRFPPFPNKGLDSSIPMRIVTVCELTPRKGVDILLQAMPLLWRHFPEVTLHIIGHGDATDELKRQAASLDPEMKRIVFHGALQNPYAYLSQFDLFVLASRSDNLPVVFLEAMLARLPIVATDVGGCSEILTPAQCGTIVPPNSSELLADGILALLQKGRRKISSLGRRGERFCRRQYDVRKTTKKLVPVYHQSMQRGKHRRLIH